MTPFDPDAAAIPGSGLFGLPPTGPNSREEARVWVIPVPFDATTSYRQGTARGPEAVLHASVQVDLHDPVAGSPWRAGICMLDPDPHVVELQTEANALARPIHDRAGAIADVPGLRAALGRVNAIGAELDTRVHAVTAAALEVGKLPIVLGGDHSVPFGAIRAASERQPGLGVLHFDAHADLRDAYEGFTWSHASIFHNVLERLPDVARLVQVGVRDLGEREAEAIERSGGRIHTVFDHEWARVRLEGGDLHALARDAIAELPEHVYVSFDVDGLDPSLCPNTGTPVPGGLTWQEAMLWLDALRASGRHVVAADLCEVNPGPIPVDAGPGNRGDSWDAIVGARLLYRILGAALGSPGGPTGNVGPPGA